MAVRRTLDRTTEPRLVTVSCAECGASIDVGEDVAGGPTNPVTCEDCVHDCVGSLEAVARDELASHVPVSLAVSRCAECGELWTFNPRSGRHERGLPEAIDR